MTYDLFIGDRLYSSWSLRGWLMFEKFSIPCRTHMVGLYSGTMSQDMADLGPARLVPTLRTPEGVVVGESLAIAETLAETFPDAGLWPHDPACRATARWLCSEMATGFSALRNTCPMQLSHVWEGFSPSPETRSDLERIETLWAHARMISGSRTPWLFGKYSLADVFYTPVAARVVGYDLPVSGPARAYCNALLSDPAFVRWREMAIEVTYDPEPYRLDLTARPWPAAS